MFPRPFLSRRFSTLVLLRHGESQWNLENRFTGWVDVPLSARGVQEAIKSGQKLKAAGFSFDIAFTSVLKRAICTYNYMSESLDCMHIPLYKSWRLNERHYGKLQGLNKKETTAQHGEQQVQLWRRSFDTPPPFVDLSDKHYPGNDSKYKSIDRTALPRGESLKLTSDRVLPYWYDQIAPRVIEGKKVVVVAHGNSLRAIVMYLNKISENGEFSLNYLFISFIYIDIAEFNIPTGVPMVYQFEDGSLNLKSWSFLESEEELKRKLEAVKAQSKGK